MKIIQFIPSLASGGAERFVVSLANELMHKGHEVIVCVLYGDGEQNSFNKQFLAKEVKYISFSCGGLSTINIIKRVNSFIRGFKPDIVHCHLAVLQYVLPSVLNGKIKCFHTIHNLAQYADGGGGWHAKLYKFLYKKQLVIPVTISEECHESYKDYYELNNDTMIPNGCEEPKVTEIAKEVLNEIQSYKPTKNSKVFIHVARYHAQKNQKLLVDVFNELNRKGLDYVLLIVGNGFESIEAKELVSSACDKIHFLGIKNNVADYLAGSDAFCLTSIYEGLPISLLEAMSMNVVPICTPVGGIVNVVEDGKSGYLSKEISQESYIEAVLRFINEWKGGTQLYETFVKNYSMESCASKYLKCYIQNNY